MRHGPHHAGPEIHQDRNLAVANDLLEFVLVDFNRLGDRRNAALHAPQRPVSER